MCLLSLQVTGEGRIKGTLPTLQYLLDKGAKSIVLISHLGRPDGKPNKKYTLAPVAPVVAKLLGKPVTFVPECVGPAVEVCDWFGRPCPPPCAFAGLMGLRGGVVRV
jgi:3-phosphoglycerate kinase